jgi:uridine kinase
MANMVTAGKPVCLGIGGGSGSGKSWLAQHLKARFAQRAVIVCQDWYYRHNGDLSDDDSRKLNFDHPRAIEMPLMSAQLAVLLSGAAVDAPVYDYATHSRLERTRRVEPAELIILEGLLVLHDKRLRELMDCSVFIDVPADLRLARRIRRDTVERRVDLEETLRLYEHCVKPMHERFIQPSSAHATWVWRQEEDKRFPSDLLRTLEKRLSDQTCVNSAPK